MVFETQQLDCKKQDSKNCQLKKNWEAKQNAAEISLFQIHPIHQNQISNPTTSNTKISSFGSLFGWIWFEHNPPGFVNMPYKKTRGGNDPESLCNVRVLVKDQGFKLFFEESNRHNTGILVAYGIRCFRCLMSQLPPCLFAEQRESWRSGNSFMRFMVERSVDSEVIRHSNWVAVFSAEILDTDQAHQWFLKE